MPEPTATLVDSCVLLDLFTDDPVWGRWSTERLAAAARRGALFINDLVYAEVSVGFSTIEAFDEALEEARIEVRPLPRAADFLAGKAFLAYRSRVGAKGSPLPDFFIGAHAAVTAVPLLTRDPRRVRAAYPSLVLDCPEVAP
jgi:hypothetical protein